MRDNESAATLSLERVLASLGIDPSAIARRGLVVHDEAKECVFVGVGLDGREHFLVPAAAEAWQRMTGQARQDGVELAIASSFRSVARQAEIIHAKLGLGLTIAEVLASVAPPGYSEHHTGRAVDIVTPDHPELAGSFATTAAFAWLGAEAGRFGFVMSYPEDNRQGYVHEPWHWCFHP